MENQMLLQAYLKRLKLPAVLGNYQEIARQTAQANQSYESYLLALAELEVQHRDENAHKRRVRLARFPMIKTLDQFDFTAVPSLNKAQVLSSFASKAYVLSLQNQNLNVSKMRIAPRNMFASKACAW